MRCLRCVLVIKKKIMATIIINNISNDNNKSSKINAVTTPGSEWIHPTLTPIHSSMDPHD